MSRRAIGALGNEKGDVSKTHVRLAPLRFSFTRSRVTLCLGFVTTLVLNSADTACAAPQQSVRSSERDIPISAKVDIVVVGGNEGGIAAAWTAAKAGSSVLVVCGNYFFSDDVSAKARYWLESDEIPRSDFSRELFGEPSGRRTMLFPAQYKRKIEDMLLKAGVAFHFNRNVYVLSQATGVSRAIAEKLTRPVHLAELGVRIGSHIHPQAAECSMPSAVSVKRGAGASFVDRADVSDLLTGHRRYVRASLGKVRQPETAVPVWGEYDVVVVGGGTSGIPAAMGAARNGAKVLIIEMLGQLGGNRELGTAGYWKGYPYGFSLRQ